MRLLVLTNLFPPHHAGTYDVRCQEITDALRLRGHELRILTSNHGLKTEQRDEEIERRLILNGVYGHPEVTAYAPLERLERHNNTALREAIADFQPQLVYVWSLHGLSKSLLFTLRHARLATVFDVADGWIAQDLRLDPWLRWWNAPGANLARGGLELAGQRSRLDAIAPTRPVRGVDRLPEVYGAADGPGAAPPDSITSFRFDRLYFCSQALRQRTIEAGFHVSQGEVIYPGVPPDLFFGDPRPSSVPLRKLLLVSRIDQASGVQTAVRALGLVRQQQLSVTLSVYGRGESEVISQVRSQVVQSNLPVEFLTVSNQTRDLAAVYRQHDALLYTAEWEEPFATVPLQAMACGLPVIGATIGGASELFRHRENAFTFTSGDANELAARIHELHLQPALREQMAATAQAEVFTHFTQTAVVDRIEAFLNQSMEIWQQS